MLKCDDCRQRFSIKVGTLFEDAKLPLRKWFMANWLITNHQKSIALNYQSAPRGYFHVFNEDLAINYELIEAVAR